MFKTNIVPKIMHLDKLNPLIEEIIGENIEFPTKNINKHINLIGVSSFGFGGTNAHVILQKYDNKKDKEYVEPVYFNKKKFSWKKETPSQKIGRLYDRDSALPTVSKGTRTIE